jgi:hypothetical protein
MAFASIVCCFTNRDRGRMQGQDALLLDVLGWNEFHVGPRRGLADRRGIGRAVLLSLLHERFDRFGGNQFHRVTEAGEHTGPMVGSATSLRHDRSAFLFLEERDQLAPAQFKLDLHLSRLVRALDRKDRLGCV